MCSGASDTFSIKQLGVGFSKQRKKEEIKYPLPSLVDFLWFVALQKDSAFQMVRFFCCFLKYPQFHGIVEPFYETIRMWVKTGF